jgi:C1A family cysteine protease
MTGDFSEAITPTFWSTTVKKLCRLLASLIFFVAQAPFLSAGPSIADLIEQAPVQANAKHGRGHKEPQTAAEKAARLLKHLDSLNRHHAMLKKAREKALPASFDCRTMGWVPPIVDQGQCLPAGTKIVMSDWSQKNIEELRIGDKVISADNTEGRVIRRFKRMIDEEIVSIEVDGANWTAVRLTKDHPIITQERGYVKSGELTANDSIRKLGYWVPIKKLSREKFKGFVYNLEVSGDHTYFANGTPVRNCGSCWDFSGTSVATSAFMKAMGASSPGPLSEQYTLDCGQNGGCDGDDNTTVLAWAKSTGLPTTADYGPYQGQAGRCKTGATLYKIADWGYCTPSSTNAVANVADIKAMMVQYGPIGCGIDAGSDAFSNYTSGVFTAAPSTNIDHDIVLVGWQDDPTVSGGGYWILRNSWGTSWGQAGYMFISYGSCGVGWEAVWAIVAGPTPPPGNLTPVITSASTASGTVGSPFSYQIVASNSPTIYGATGLPTGLTLSGSGSITGTPTAAGNSIVIISATNSAGSGSANLTLTVGTTPPPPSGNVTITLTAQQVQAVISQSGAVLITGDMTVTQLMDALQKCRTPSNAEPPMLAPNPQQDRLARGQDAILECLQKAVLPMLQKHENRLNELEKKFSAPKNEPKKSGMNPARFLNPDEYLAASKYMRRDDFWEPFSTKAGGNEPQP